MDLGEEGYSVMERKVAMEILGWVEDPKTKCLRRTAKDGSELLIHPTGLRLFDSYETIFSIREHMKTRFSVEMFILPEMVLFRSVNGKVNVSQKLHSDKITRSVAYGALKALDRLKELVA